MTSSQRRKKKNLKNLLRNFNRDSSRGQDSSMESEEFMSEGSSKYVNCDNNKNINNIGEMASMTSSRTSASQNHKIVRFLQSEKKSFSIRVINYMIIFAFIVLLGSSSFAYFTLTNSFNKSYLMFETLDRY